MTHRGKRRACVYDHVEVLRRLAYAEDRRIVSQCVKIPLNLDARLEASERRLVRNRMSPASAWPARTDEVQLAERSGGFRHRVLPRQQRSECETPELLPAKDSFKFSFPPVR